MTDYRWLKLWNEAPTDPKWLAVADMAGSSPSLAWHTFSAALAYANEQPNRGSIVGFDPRVIAAFCRVTVDEVRRVMQALREFGLLLGERIAKWTKRQTEKLERPRTANAERQARHRQKVAERTAQGVFDLPQPALHETVIPAAEEEKEPSVRISESNDSESIPQQRKKREVDAEFQGFWEQCPRKVEKVAARKAYRKARQGGADWNTLVSGMRRYAGECVGKDPQYIKHPATWLNKGCWADEPIGVVSVPVSEYRAPCEPFRMPESARIFLREGVS